MNKCKSQLFLFILFFFSMSSSFATDFGVRALIDKTYVRDNSYCKFQEKKFEIEIRSFDQYTTPADASYGEHFFLVQNGNYKLIPSNKSLLGRYRFLKGKDTNCTKSLSIRHPDNGLSIFFLKDIRPLHDTLAVVTYYPASQSFTVEDTNYGVVKAFSTEKLLWFSSTDIPHPVKVGKVRIKGQDYIFVRKKLISWFVYDGSKFTFDLEMTFKNFEYKKFFKQSADLKKAFFPANTKPKEYYSIATRPQTKLECFSMDFPESHNWECQ